MASKNNSLVKKILSDSGHSWTAVREDVFEAVSKGGPMSMNELIKKLAGKVDRVSVYRSIELFEGLGIVHRISVGWKYKIELSDRFVEHHHHLSCIKCGKIIDIEDERHINHFIKEVASRFDFEPKSHQFEIEGLCENCRTK